MSTMSQESDSETGDLASQKQNLQVTGFIVTMHAEQSQLPAHFPGCLRLHFSELPLIPTEQPI